MIFEKDRLLPYFKKYLGTFLFVEFSKEFMQKLHIEDIADGVRVPIKPHDLEKFAGGEGISATNIAENMVVVMGLDPNFKYNDSYKEYIKRFFDDKLLSDVLMAGVKSVEAGDLDMAAVNFRAALCIKKDFLEALYNYARVCREVYMSIDSEVDMEKKGNYKAEMIDALEELTIAYPDFAEPYYFLGYSYLNMGLYEKAGLVFEKFMKLSKDEEALTDVAKKLSDLVEPRKIEEGTNYVISGNYEKGLELLLPFMSGKYESWWPLHFYLGIAFEETGSDIMAVMEYKKTLELNALCIDAIDGLIRIYDAASDDENVEKYTKKKQIIIETYTN